VTRDLRRFRAAHGNIGLDFRMIAQAIYVHDALAARLSLRNGGQAGRIDRSCRGSR
jgi:hypothetical protein